MLDSIKKEIAKKRKEIIELEDILANPSIKNLAIFKHDKECHDSHTDRCGWLYEIKDGVHDWSRSSHSMWLDRAKREMEC